MMTDTLDSLIQDLRFAIRMLRKAPAFVVVSVLSLGVALAAVTTMLAIVQATDFQQLPFKDADRLVKLSRRMAPQSSCPNCRGTPSPPVCLEWRQRARSYSELEASKRRSFDIRTGDDREFLPGRAAT